MVKTAFYVLAFVILLLIAGGFLIGWHIFRLLGLKKYLQQYGHLVSYYWAKQVVRFAGVRVEISGEENIPREGAVVFVGNHQGNFDIPLVLGYIDKPKAFLAKTELSKVPILSSWMKALQCVFIDRSNLKQSIKAIQQCIDVVKNGQSMMIFPEGTRSKGPEIGEFKKGSLRVAEKSGVPVVPVAINGTYKIMEANQGKIKSASVSMQIAPPIYYDKLTKEEQGRFHEIVRDVIARSLARP